MMKLRYDDIISYTICNGLRSSGQEKCDRYFYSNLDTSAISSIFLSPLFLYYQFVVSDVSYGGENY